jgi:carboxynorspermidine decarboxylase
MLSLDPGSFDLGGVETPCYVVDLGLLRRNLEILARVQREAECKILLALKGFAMWRVFPLVGEYLGGIAASSPHEAELGRTYMNREVHAYAPAYSEADMREIVRFADHVVFNSLSQWHRLRPLVQAAERPVSCGLRVNPEHSEVKVALYDPCAPCSRLGVPPAQFPPADWPSERVAEALSGLSGLHFHSLCELGADALERTLGAFERKFAHALPHLRWVNFGGGHHITRPDYDVEQLIRLVRGFRDRHRLEVYLEPGEAIALNTGVLVASVLDIVHNDMDIAILDTSATAHMPDVLEMPYRPRIIGAGEPGEHRHTYRLGGLTCLAGDVIGDYSFAEPLTVGSKLVFLDMAHYTMVKNTTFNGVRLPSIATYEPATGELDVVRRFGYADYRDRLS